MTHGQRNIKLQK